MARSIRSLLRLPEKAQRRIPQNLEASGKTASTESERGERGPRQAPERRDQGRRAGSPR